MTGQGFAQPPGDLGIHRALRSFSLYVLARVAGGAVRLLTVPFILHAVSATAFGTLTTLWIPMLVVHGICDLGLGTAAVRFAPESSDAPDRRILFATLLSARVLSSLFVSGIVIAVHEPLARALTGTDGNGPALLVLASSRPFAVLFDAFSDELRSRGAMPQLSTVVLASTVAIQALSVLFTVGLGRSLEGLVWARALGDALAFLAGAALCARFVVAAPSFARLRQLSTFGWPLGVLYAINMLRGFDRPLIRVLENVEQVAAYELSMRLVGPVGLSNIALALVLEPLVYGRSEARETPTGVGDFLRAYTFVFTSVAMGLSVVGPELVQLFAPPEYHGAIRALPALAFATTCEGLQRISGIGADLAKRTRGWAVVSTVAVGLGLGLAALLVPRLGIPGAGVAWVIGNGAATVVAYRAARRVSEIVLPVGRALLLVGGGALAGTLAAWHPWPLPARLGLGLAYVPLAWVVMRVRFEALRSLF